MIRLGVCQLEQGKGLPFPYYATEGASGIDLFCALPENQPVILKPLERFLVPTGVCFSIPVGFEAQIRPRSGLALKHGVTVLNAPGTIDWDYSGEIKVLLINLGQQPYTLHRGLRIAQCVVARTHKAVITPYVTPVKSVRSDGGFGSTGE